VIKALEGFAKLCPLQASGAGFGEPAGLRVAVEFDGLTSVRFDDFLAAELALGWSQPRPGLVALENRGCRAAARLTDELVYAATVVNYNQPPSVA
jgi:hypothetical protein